MLITSVHNIALCFSDYETIWFLFALSDVNYIKRYVLIFLNRLKINMKNTASSDTEREEPGGSNLHAIKYFLV